MFRLCKYAVVFLICRTFVLVLAPPIDASFCVLRSGYLWPYYTFLDGEPFVAFGVAFHPPVKPEGMLSLETLLGLGGALLFQPF